jgi:AbrB family looped-hinge helix DNA binding protein
MPTKVTSKGQITLPKRVRDGLGIKPGDEIEFVAEAGEFRIQKVLGENPFSRYRGHLKDLAGQDPDELVQDIRGE